MEKMKDLAAHAGGVDVAALALILEIERLKLNAEDLALMASELWLKGRFETYANRQMALELARLEIERLAKTYSHAALQLGLKASLAMEEGK